MKHYQKEIKQYNKLMQKQYIREESVKRCIDRCEDIVAERLKDSRISHFEFIYEQARYIEKKWWMIQGVVLLFLWYLLWDNGMEENVERVIGIFATVFAILIIPEIWKNHRYSSIAVEKASYYSLRDICAARILLFAVVDMGMVSMFFLVASNTVQIPTYRLAVDFLIPSIVSCCICFQMLCHGAKGMEYISAVLCAAWNIVWMAVVTNDAVYGIVAESIWIGLILLSFGYLVLCIQKSLSACEKSWEV